MNGISVEFIGAYDKTEQNITEIGYIPFKVVESP